MKGSERRNTRLIELEVYILIIIFLACAQLNFLLNLFLDLTFPTADYSLFMPVLNPIRFLLYLVVNAASTSFRPKDMFIIKG